MTDSEREPKEGLISKILIVDDDQTNREILQRILRKDHHVILAGSGEEAIACMEEHSIDLILLDVMMPKMSGYQVCEQLKANEHTKHVPIVFVSAMDQVMDEKKGLELGGIDYIHKPVSAPIVRARVRNHLALKHYQDQLRDLAAVDGLTGVGNRRRFDESLEQEWRRTLRAQTPLSIIMVDIDYFKNFNDKYGHLAGDDCLKQVGMALQGVIQRPSDLLARYGGEEFVFLLPNTDQEGAMDVAQRGGAAVEQLAIPHADSAAAHHVSISLGVATVIPQNTLSALDLLSAADQALYQAKEAGRNKVVGKLLQ